MSHITCQECGQEIHAVQTHIKSSPECGPLDDYKSRHPLAPLFSKDAQALVDKAASKFAASKTEMAQAAENVVQLTSANALKPLFEIFSLPRDQCLNKRGENINVTVLPQGHLSEFVPEVDPNYVYNQDVLRTALMGVELNIPTMLFGHAGTGKTTVVEQIAARTLRPFIRVNHTANMEESDLTGQWTVKSGETIFSIGPLAYAMKHGLLYLADEYDMGYPSILATYQAPLEGKPLVIKDADEANRIIRPHENFRFFATGNTNGTSDESGLYQGTVSQNAANYSRFGITYEISYMETSIESKLLRQQANLEEADAATLVTWAQKVREAFQTSKINSTVGPRELIYAGVVGSRRGSMREGISLAITNRMSLVDRKICEELAQRYLGS